MVLTNFECFITLETFSKKKNAKHKIILEEEKSDLTSGQFESGAPYPIGNQDYQSFTNKEGVPPPLLN